MAKSVLELAVGTGQWDAGLKKARTALDNFTQANGGLQSALTKDSTSMQKFVQMMGRMDSTAKTAKGQMNDYKGTIEQLTMQYNRLTDAQKKTIGQDYLRSIDQMKQKYQGVAEEVNKINQSLKSMPEPAALSGGGGLFGGDNLSGMLQVFGGNVMTKLAGVGVGFVSELKDMVAQGIELARAGEGIRIAFERLNKPGLLDNLREATHGTVTDLELMKAAVKFNDFKLPVEELGTMLAFAQQKAKDTGQSVDYMVDSIVTGLGRKSLMILDNLGLSATEIRDKMKETGDMTKAVGEIIREQMAKAGDYVETAADRATKANVELENAMTRLGETFQPLTDAANSMWNDIKIGALDLLNNAIRPLINAFTEAGRARALYENQGGDARVNRQLDRLKGIQSDSYRQGTYKAQLRNYDTQIASHEQYLKDYKAWQSDNTNVGAYDRMQKFKQQTGLEWVSDVQAHLDAFKKMRSEYVQGAKAILEGNPVPSPTSTTTTTSTGGASGNTFDASKITFTGGEGFKAEKPGFEPMMNTIDFMAGLRKEMGMDGEQTRDWGKELGKVLSNYIDDPDKNKRNKQERDDDRRQEAIYGNISRIAGSVQGMFSTLEQMGIEIPDELKSMVSGVQSIMEFMSAMTALVSTIAGTSTIKALPIVGTFAHNGAVIHAAGGAVTGNTYSGDQIPAMLNAGEVVLNRSQVGSLASALSGERGGGQNAQPFVTGDIIFLGLQNYLQENGYGKLMTTNMR